MLQRTREMSTPIRVETIGSQSVEIDTSPLTDCYFVTRYITDNGTRRPNGYAMARTRQEANSLFDHFVSLCQRQN